MVDPRLVLVGVVSLTAAGAAAALPVRGHFKYQPVHHIYESDDLAAAVNGRHQTDHTMDVRVIYEQRKGAWDFTAHYQILAITGDTPETTAQIAAGPLQTRLLPTDQRRLLDLTGELIDENRTQAVHRLDHLTAGYTGRSLVLRLGRQAVSWGHGFVYQPMDIFNPFEPAAVDTDYKNGDDMLYGQWLEDDGDDWQMVLVPRRNPQTDDVEAESSSLAVKYRTATAMVDLDLLAARHYGENLVSIGTVKSIGGSVWRTDLTVTRLDSGGYAWQAVTNMDYSWVWWQRNVYGYAEYFHNSLGSSEVSFNNIDPDLASRLARGESFALGRDYLALGLQIELAPLWNVSLGAITHLNDPSTLLPLRLVYDWRENVLLHVGANLAVGGRGTEFGGLDVTGAGDYSAPGQLLFGRIDYYF